MGHATCFQQHLSGGIKMASYKDYKTVAAAKKAGSLYFMGKDGKKKLAVTAETLKTWKKKNKGKFKGSALTAWANNKGKDIKGVLRPKARPKSADMSTSTLVPKVTMTTLRPPLDRGKRDPRQGKSVAAITKKADSAIKSMPNRRAKDGGLSAFEESLREKGNEAALKAHLKAKRDGNPNGIFKSRRKNATGAAKGGMMKKKGYAMGGALKKAGPKQTGVKKLPTSVRNKMGYMAKGGMMKKKGYAKGGAAKKKK